MSKFNSLVPLTVILLITTACATRPPQEVSAPADSAFVRFRYGQLNALRDSITRALDDSLLQSALLRWWAANGSGGCPMPVWVPVPGATVKMPIVTPDTSATIPMPTMRITCFNPLFRPR
jgi:hypothetical protein